MSVAMRNERLAVRQKLADAYRGHLSAAQIRIERHCQEIAAELEKLARVGPAPTAFAACLRSGVVDAVILLDEQGNISYPNKPSGLAAGFGELDNSWAEAGQIEFLKKDPAGAAAAYRALFQRTTNTHLAARVLQAQARCLVQAGEKESAIRVVNEVLAGEKYRHAADAQGRLIAANAELMVLELLSDPASPAFQSTAQSLKARVEDYSNPILAAPQRRFLMKELQRLSQGKVQFPTLAAEELAATLSDNQPVRPSQSIFQSTPLADLWQLATPDHRVVAFIHSDKLLALLRPMLAPPGLPVEATIALLPPGADIDTSFVARPAGTWFPGWRLAITLEDQKAFDLAAEHRIASYLWTGSLMVAGMVILTLLAVRLLRRQAALARLKNDLAATVSHELKTPLSSMRVLVDTLLDAKQWDEQTVREYLLLISQENERLRRVIENFLAFSRMERNRHVFRLERLPVRQVIDNAVRTVRDRFASPECRFDVEVEENLPEIMADADTLPAALTNLLDNAYKYSEDNKHIVLRARTEKGNVVFSVEDNGIGIAPRETKRIFHRFYQVDPRLSSKGSGCGLGLSIVQFIAAAHHGSVTVNSTPGRGSTFTLSLPAWKH